MQLPLLIKITSFCHTHGLFSKCIVLCDHAVLQICHTKGVSEALYWALLQAGWLILESFPEHVDVLAFMNAIDNLFGKFLCCGHALPIALHDLSCAML